MAGIISRLSDEQRSEILRENIEQVLEALNDSSASENLIHDIETELDGMSPDEIADWAKRNPYCIESTFMYDDVNALSNTGYVDANARLVIIAKSLDMDYHFYVEDAVEEKFEGNIGLQSIFKKKIEEVAKQKLENMEFHVNFRRSER